MAFSTLVAAKNANILDDPMIGVVLDKYEITELIDTGSWGNVYKATDLNLGTEVAVKVIHKHVLKDQENIKRFRREARLLSCFQSNHVIKVIDADISPVPYMVMEYFDGIPLNKWVRQNGPMSAQMAVELFAQVCRALSEAEACNIVHRDLKPANILVKTHGNIVEAKILDFGLAKCLDASSTVGSKITSSGDIIGSPGYMSPEQFKGQCDNRSDIYSLGCIMYEMLTGRPAFLGKNSIEYLHQHLSANPQRMSEANPSVKQDAGLEKIVLKCLEKSPKKRYQSADLLRMELNKSKPNHFRAELNSKQKITKVSLTYSAALIIAFVAFQMFGHPPMGSAAGLSGNKIVCISEKVEQTAQ